MYVYAKRKPPIFAELILQMRSENNGIIKVSIHDLVEIEYVRVSCHLHTPS